MSEMTQISVRILDKDYLIACPAEEKEALIESAHIMEDKVREIRQSGKVIGAERIAVMAAINLAHELLQYRHSNSDHDRDISLRLRHIQEKIESVLEGEDPQLSL